MIEFKYGQSGNINKKFLDFFFFVVLLLVANFYLLLSNNLQELNIKKEGEIRYFIQYPICGSLMSSKLGSGSVLLVSCESLGSWLRNGIIIISTI